MHIAVENNFALPLRVPEQLLRVVNSRVQQTIRWCPLTIQITT